MPTRNEQKRTTLTKKIDAVKGKIAPLQRELKYYESELQLLDDFENDELEQAVSTIEKSLGITIINNSAGYDVKNNPSNED